MSNRTDASLPNYYARLGVEPTASADEIRAAYRQKARETHPDRNPDDPRATDRFQRVKEAYQVLRDPERRARYDEIRSSRRRPGELIITQQAPGGCRGYLWRVLAGLVAVGLFFALEGAGVWSAGTWSVVLAVGAASIVAALVAVALAQQFPNEASDVSMRLTTDGVAMWADSRVIFRLPWSRVQAVRLREDGAMLDLVVERDATRRLQPVPPVLVAVDRRRRLARLRLDLSDTDVSPSRMGTFLRITEAVPFPAPNPPPSSAWPAGAG